ncbi:MAG TPA: XdhC family protein [Gemmatimonadaceae bacterium]|nr:XdhC family protein [Gemmatimonadaceae bacterium]
MAHGLIDHGDLLLRDETGVALATLVSATGSTAKKLGAKMIVGRSGRLIGGVTIGGCVDAQVIEAADALIDLGERRLLSISLDDDEAWEIGLTCGGSVDVLLERITPADIADPVAAAHRVVQETLDRGSSAVLVTPIDGAAAALVVDETGLRHGTLGNSVLDAAAIAIASDVANSGARVESLESSGSSRRFFFDRFAPPTTLLIIGAGQIAMSLTRFARELEMRTIVIDGRERYATRDRFPDADEIRVGMPSEIVASVTPNKRVAVVLVAHDYKYELPILRQLLREPVGYLGMLGSKKRGVAVRDLLRDEGFTDDELARIHTPIGLDLGGKSPAEVALSILAEVVAIRSGKRV